MDAIKLTEFVVERVAMSSISSASNGLYQVIQSLQASPASTATASTTATTGTPASGLAGAIQGSHHRHGGHGKGGESQLFSQLQQAVSSALQSARQGGNTNPIQTIENAIAKVFKASGPATTQSVGGNSALTAAGPDGDAAKGATKGSSSPNSSTQAFLQTLQSFGVDPQQFRQDFLSAVQSAQSGQSSASTAFASFPPGSIINTLG